MSFLLYATAKYLAYSLWCYVGLHLFALPKRSIHLSLKYGAIRWLLGLAFGVSVALLAGSIPAESASSYYFAIYTPLRIIEWGIIAALICKGRKNIKSLHVAAWVFGGIFVSFLSDVFSPDGLAGRFCVGRCLC